MINLQQLAHFTEEFGTEFFTHVRTARPQSILLFGRPDANVAAGLAAISDEQELVIHAIDSCETLPGSENCRQYKSKVQMTLHSCPMSNLKRNSRQIEERLRTHPCTDSSTWRAALQELRAQEDSAPLFADASIDFAAMALSVNYLSPIEAAGALREAVRVLKRNGKLLIMVILADECVKDFTLKFDGHLPLLHFPTEMQFVRALADAGLHGIRIVNSELPVVAAGEHAELRMFIFEAYKGKQGECLDQGHAVIFRGPWSEVHDDDGHRYVRGERTAVCAKTYALLTTEPYRSLFIGIPARNAPALIDAPLFDCSTPRVRDPQVTKGFAALSGGVQSSSCC